MRDRVSILTEDGVLARAVATPLGRSGYEVQVLSTAPKHWQRTKGFLSGLLLVDLDTMPNDPLTHCRRLQALTTARIMVLAQPQNEDKMLETFRIGVDEYLTKPIGEMELVARVEALLRRQQVAGSNRAPRVPVCRDVTLDVDQRTLNVRGRHVKLTPIEYGLLQCLIRHAGTVVPRSTLLRQAWGDQSNPSVESLNLYIYYLRRKIEHDPRHPKHILTKWGVGYYLVQ